jgi:hypothetical protein
MSMCGHRVFFLGGVKQGRGEGEKGRKERGKSERCSTEGGVGLRAANSKQRKQEATPQENKMTLRWITQPSNEDNCVSSQTVLAGGQMPHLLKNDEPLRSMDCPPKPKILGQVGHRPSSPWHAIHHLNIHEGFLGGVTHLDAPPFVASTHTHTESGSQEKQRTP